MTRERRRWLVTVLLILVALAAATAWLYPPARGAVRRALAGPKVQRVEMTGDDLARALRLKAWKFNLVLPRGAEEDNGTRVVVWVEEWKKGAAAPVKHTLANMSGAWRTTEVPMLLHVPEGPGHIVVAVGGLSSYKDVPPSLAAVKPDAVSVAGQEDLEFGKEVALVKLEYAAPGGPRGSSVDPSEVLPSNDLTFIFKMRWDRETPPGDPEP